MRNLYKGLLGLALLIGLIFLAFLPTFAAKEVAANDAQSSQQVQDIIKRGVLRVGVKQDVPNFGYLEPETEDYTGMEIDLARKIAQDLGVEVEFTPVTAQTRGALIDNGQVDMVIATFTITEERKKLFNFTEAYYTDASGFLVNKSSGISSWEDLDGKNIGVAQGSIQQRLLKEIAREEGYSFSFTELGSYPELAVSLSAHRIDAFSVDQSILSGYAAKSNELLDLNYSPAQYGIVTKKSNTDLNDYLNGLLEDWTADGGLQQIYDEYSLKPVSELQEN